MSRKPKILVMGATGQVGGAVLPYLAGNSNVDVIAAVRTPEKARGFGVPVVHLDLDKFETIGPALHGIDRVCMATGYTVDMLRQSKDLVNVARRAGVQQIVHLGACGDDDTRIAHYGWHQFIERYIEWAKVTFTHLRPEIFMQNLLGYGGAKFVKNGVIRHYVGGARLSWVDCDDVAAVAASCLLDPEKHAGQTYRLGYEATRLRRVTELVHAKIEEELTLHEMALCAELSPAHFSEMFRKSTGESPHQFVLRQRVERAKEMLREADMRVLDVAVACGFKTQQHFARVFRRMCGGSPTEYRYEVLR